MHDMRKEDVDMTPYNKWKARTDLLEPLKNSLVLEGRIFDTVCRM